MGTISEETQQILDRLTAKQETVARARPLPEVTIRSLLDDFLIRYAHETTAIEGNTLSLRETQVILEQGITVGGKTLREHLEIINVRDAWRELQDLVQHRTEVTEDTILTLHRLLTKEVLGEDAGRYRRVPVYISGSMHVPPNWVKVAGLMAEFVAGIRQGPGAEHPVPFAALAHVRLAGIHPFVDGNGRVCRMLVNLLLMRSGYPPALYTTVNRTAYMKALESAQFRDQPEPFIMITAQAAEFLLDRYLHAIQQVREAEAEAPDR